MTRDDLLCMAENIRERARKMNTLDIADERDRAVCFAADAMKEHFHATALGPTGPPIYDRFGEHEHQLLTPNQKGAFIYELATGKPAGVGDLKRFRAVLEFQGYDNEELRASGLPPLDKRIRECIETHPIASFKLDSVAVHTYPPKLSWDDLPKDENNYGRVCGLCGGAVPSGHKMNHGKGVCVP